MDKSYDAIVIYHEISVIVSNKIFGLMLINSDITDQYIPPYMTATVSLLTDWIQKYCYSFVKLVS